MKTKRRVQALITVLAMLTALCGGFAGVYADDTASTETLPSYRASDAFVWKDASGTALTKQPAQSGQWKWERYDSTTSVYELLSGTGNNNKPVNATRFAATADNAYSYTYEKDDTGGFAYVSSAQDSAAVGKYWMSTSMNTTWKADSTRRYYAVRTFVVPESGNVAISTLDHNGESKIWAKKSENTSLYPMKLRIAQKNSDGTIKKVWPADTDWAVLARGGSLAFTPFRLNVEKGQELYFELRDDNGDLDKKDARIDLAAYWDPVVAYNFVGRLANPLPEKLNAVPLNQVFTVASTAPMGNVAASNITITGGSTEASVKPVNMSDDKKNVSFSFNGLEVGQTYKVTLKDPNDTTATLYSFDFTTIAKRYQASEVYKTGASNNPSGLWQWDYYDNTAATKAYQKLPYFRNATASARGFSRVNNRDNCTAVDATHMYLDANSWAYARNYNAVRTFTVPRTGNVTITADDVIKGTSANNPNVNSNVLIALEQKDGMCKTLWSHEGIRGNAPLEFLPLTYDLEQGDKLHFELKCAYDTNPAASISVYGAQIQWDPVVEYNSFVTVESLLPEDLNAVPQNQEFTLTTTETMGTLTTADVTIVGESADAGTPSVK